MRTMLYEVRFSVWMSCKALDGESFWERHAGRLLVVVLLGQLLLQLVSTSGVNSSGISCTNSANISSFSIPLSTVALFGQLDRDSEGLDRDYTHVSWGLFAGFWG
jgi:hypothetical protein